MKKYEIMFIVRPTLKEDEIKSTVSRFEKVLTDNEAKIENIKEMGQREFAYEIDKMKSGYYYVINITSENDKAIKEFDRQSRNTQNIIRHLITKIED